MVESADDELPSTSEEKSADKAAKQTDEELYRLKLQ
jgi:hypothetical protein